MLTGNTSKHSTRKLKQSVAVGKGRKSPPLQTIRQKSLFPCTVAWQQKCQATKIKIPDSKTYLPIKGYYRIRIGITTVGGFSTPEGNDFSLYFIPMRHAKPTGKRNKINTTEELVQLIKNQLETE